MTAIGNIEKTLVPVAQTSTHPALTHDSDRFRILVCAILVISGGIALCFCLMNWMCCSA